MIGAQWCCCAPSDEHERYLQHRRQTDRGDERQHDTDHAAEELQHRRLRQDLQQHFAFQRAVGELHVETSQSHRPTRDIHTDRKRPRRSEVCCVELERKLELPCGEPPHQSRAEEPEGGGSLNYSARMGSVTTGSGIAGKRARNCESSCSRSSTTRKSRMAYSASPVLHAGTRDPRS